MKQPSRITFALIVVLVITGAALMNRQAPSKTAPIEASPSGGKFDTVVGDETPFTPEW